MNETKNKGSENSEIRSRANASGVDVWCRHDELIDVTELIENPRNPNKHPDKQIALLAKIIRNQGWRQPVTISKRSGFIVKGHGRLSAAKLLNVELVPVEYQEYETEAQEYADLMADNRIAELAEPDMDMISELLNDDLFEGFDMDLTGFDDEYTGMFDVNEIAPPEMDNINKSETVQFTLTVHESQKYLIESAITSAKDLGASESDVNENKNGNAIAWICERWLNGQG